MTRRRGTLVAEGVMALTLVGIAIALAVQLAATLGASRRVAERRFEALAAARNVLEEWTARPFATITPEAASEAKTPEGLPGKLVVVVSDEPDGGRRVAVAVRADSKAGTTFDLARLSAWVYPAAETAP